MKIFLKNSGLTFLSSSTLTLEKVKSIQYAYLQSNASMYYFNNENYYLDVYDISEYNGKQITVSARRSNINSNIGGYADGSIPTGSVITSQNVSVFNNELGNITLVDDPTGEESGLKTISFIIPVGAKVLLLYRNRTTDVTSAVVSLI